MLPQILKQADHLDIFHANAGAYIGGEAATGNPDAWDRMLNLNINAAFRSVHAVLQYMIDRKIGSAITGTTPAIDSSMMTSPLLRSIIYCRTA